MSEYEELLKEAEEQEDQEEILITKGQYKEAFKDGLKAGIEIGLESAAEQKQKDEDQNTGLTREQILNVKDRNVRERLIARNRHLFQ